MEEPRKLHLPSRSWCHPAVSVILPDDQKPETRKGWGVWGAVVSKFSATDSVITFQFLNSLWKVWKYMISGRNRSGTQ
jgi:hypothetical protein